MEKMASIREKIIGQINSIQDETMLMDVYNILYGMQETKKILRLNNEQKSMVREGRDAYDRGEFVSSEELFDDLLNDDN